MPRKKTTDTAADEKTTEKEPTKRGRKSSAANTEEPGSADTKSTRRGRKSSAANTKEPAAKRKRDVTVKELSEKERLKKFYAPLMNKHEAKSDSIFSYILDNIEGDRLPRGFSIGAKFAPIVTVDDGYYEAAKNFGDVDGEESEVNTDNEFVPDDYELSDYEDAIIAVNDRRFDIADKVFAHVLDGEKTVERKYFSIKDYIIKNLDNVNNNAMFDYVCHLILCSDNRLLVKFGIRCSAIFVSDEVFFDLFMLLGLSDDFAYDICCVFDYRRNNKNKNKNKNKPDYIKTIFELAKKVNGWGRMFYIYDIDKNDYEQVSWLVRYGADLTVDYFFKESTVFEVGKIDNFLRKDIPYEDFAATGQLIAEILRKFTINIDTNGYYLFAEEYLSAYVNAAKRYDLSADDITVLDRIMRYYEILEMKNKSTVMMRIRKLKENYKKKHR